MRGIAAASVLALILAAPVGAAKTRDQSRSCQAGKKAAKSKAKARISLIGTRRRFAVVACEQPPKSNLTLAGSIAKTTASALSLFG